MRTQSATTTITRAVTVAITRDQLAYVLLNLGLATAGTGRAGEVSAALRQGRRRRRRRRLGPGPRR